MARLAKMSLVLLDEDRYFGEMVSAYIRSSEYGDRFAIRVFTSAEQGTHFIEHTQEPIIVMVHESLMPLSDAVYQLKPGCTVMISDQPMTTDVLEYPVLCKYQPLDRLLAEITSHYNVYCATQPLTGRKGTRVTALYSATGGMGKTVTAFHLARQLAMQGQRILCLCLEFLPSRAWYAETDREAFSRLLYYAKTNPKQIPGKLGMCRRKHPQWKFDYIPPLPSGSELLEMGGQESAALLDGLVDTAEYDRIVIDLDASPLSCIVGALQRCDELLWLVTDDAVQLAKTRELLDHLKHTEEGAPIDWQRKARFVHNKSTGRTVNSFAAYGIHVTDRLPYVPEWKSVTGVDSLYSSAFAEHAGRLITGDGAALHAEVGAHVDG